MKVGDLVQWLPHADSSEDAGLGLVMKEGRNVDGHVQYQIVWMCDIRGAEFRGGIGGTWYSGNDDKDIVVISESR